MVIDVKKSAQDKSAQDKKVAFQKKVEIVNLAVEIFTSDPDLTFDMSLELAREIHRKIQRYMESEEQ